MKKITFLFFALTLFIWDSNAQFTEGFEAGIPATWTVINGGDANTWTADVPGTGTAHTGTNVAKIVYTADAHDDYLITQQFTVTAGVSDRISFWYKHRSNSFPEIFDVLLSTGGNTAADFTVSLASDVVPTTDWQEGIFDLTAYVGQTVYVAFYSSTTDEYELYIDDVTVDTAPTDLLDYYNLQFPAVGSITAGMEFNVYAQAYEAGLTDVTDGQSAGIEAWIGYSTSNTDPSGAGWTWVIASFNGESGNNDEYVLDLGATIASTGTFYYASRWSLNGGAYTYGGIQADASYGGVWGEDNNISGVLTLAGPTNNTCSDSIALTPGLDFAANVLTNQTQFGATGSGEMPLPTCSSYDPADATGFGGDVWFSVVVPADGNLTIEIQGDPAGDGGDSGMSVYSGECGSLTEVDCDDDSSEDGFYSLITITDVTLANQMVYVRVFEYGGNARLNFQISAYSSTLSVLDFDNANAFTYFPNPVKNELNLKAQSAIQNVAIYNMLGQEVMKSAPNTLTSDINMSELQTGAYFVKVTINDVTETIRVIKQ